MIAHYVQTLQCGEVHLLAMWLIRHINLLSINVARAHQRISDALGRQCGVRTRKCLDGSLWLVKSSKIQGKIGIKWRDHNKDVVMVEFALLNHDGKPCPYG